jgi:hypothetical protein
MAGFFSFIPLGVIASNKLNKIFLGFDMGKAHKFINIPVANLASIFHILRNLFLYLPTQSLLQQQAICVQEPTAMPKQSKLPSLRWIVLIRSFFEYFQVSLTPNVFAFFSTSESLILLPSFGVFRLYKPHHAA